ncbi:MAG: tetratricopeptide repeat protein, partial [Nannocystaceae bacterium]
TFREILELDEDHFEAANSLSRLQEQIEDWMGAVETMARLVELNRDPEARIDLLTRMGRIYFEKLEDQEAAELRLNDALAIDPEYVPALDVLANLYKARMDWLKAARTLKTASQAAANNFEKTRFGAESGTIFLEELGDRDAALEMYALVMEVDPEHLEVGYRLSAMYVEDERFDAALPIYEMLARKAAQLEQSDDDLLEMYINGAKCALAMSASERALELYRSAYEIDSTSRDVLFGLADVNYHSGDRERAFKLYQTILVQHRDTQSDEDTVLVYHRLGAIKKDEGEDRKALNYFEKALEVDPNARETLSEVIELHEKSEDWEGVIEAKRALTDVADGDEQFTLFNEIGDLYSKNLGNIKKASEALHRALDLRPTDYPLLHKLLELFTKGKEWEDAISIIDRIVEIEERPKRRSKYNYTAAVLLRDNLNDHDEAIDRFNVTLDDDPSMLKAFEAIATMVTPTKDWKTLERNYRKMLKRLPGTGAEGLQLKLWEDLGEIYRSRLNDFKSAAAAFEIAAKLDPGQVKFNVVLAELYDRLVQHDAAEFGPKAVRAHQVLIAKEPFRVDSYRALFQIYQQMGAKDKAFSVAAALVFLKKANADEQAVFDASRVEGFVRARQRLSESVLQRHVLHPQQNVHLTNILGLFAAPLAVTYAKEIPSTIDQSSRVDITVDVSLFSQVANYVRDVVQVTQPDVYQRPKDPG